MVNYYETQIARMMQIRRLQNKLLLRWNILIMIKQHYQHKHLIHYNNCLLHKQIMNILQKHR